MRINEDYLDAADDTDVVNSVDDILNKELYDEMFCRQIDEIVAGSFPDKRLDFESAGDAIYPVDNWTLKRVIMTL